MQWAEKSVEGLKAMGFTAVKFKRFSGMGHESYPEVKNNFFAFFSSEISP